jgi:hypothetical protein
MYENVFMPITSLDKAPVKSSGVCSVFYFRHEDVETWPSVDPTSGIMLDAVQLKPGALLYFCEAIDSFKSFEEDEKESSAGNYFDISVKGALKGSNAANILALQTMAYHQWGLIVEDRNGVTRLVGNQDSGADLAIKYGSGDRNATRKTEISWKWQHPNTAPVYSATVFNIIIGGVIITAGCLRLIRRFRVGAAGAPMNEGDLSYTDAGFANKKLLVIASGLALPVDDESGMIDFTGSIERHIHKTLASDTIDFIGGVIDQEIIEIYAWS